MIQINNLSKRYGKTQVLDVQVLSIPAGESFGLVGNNGAGKTTLFRTILDLIRPTSGTVQMKGEPVHGRDDWKSFTGSYLDENFLIDYLTPEEYFQFIGRLHGLRPEGVAEYLGRFDEFFNGEVLGKYKYIRDLSKGNLKKVGIASALMGEPELVLLDEPFENLDPSSQIRLKKLLNAERGRRPITYLISSHDLNHITEVCQRIVILEKGRIVQDLQADENLLGSLQAYFTA
ncbi:ABC transporter ATP-binding protein [Nafulsella turpanensis]|uniref:ABC transporter ATP-binding protein n=1 Tax=Nafulsella turpanensis TaxID=1265690 RepID=UPI000344DB54|nr:ABC transporter ATP-binding protein [Nafulsella turpanensis]